MARPIGKYFAPVIKLLLDAKKNERIVVDENFKETLRMEMMAKLSAMPVDGKAGAKKLAERAAHIGKHAGEIGRQAGALGHGLKHSWWTAWEGLMFKYKYVFAGVPVALVVFVIALQIVKMPVNIPSRVEVPVISVKTEQVMEDGGAAEAGRANLMAAEADAVNSVSGAFVGEGQSKIKTFPGYLVMPAAYRAKYGLDVQTAEPVLQAAETSAAEAKFIEPMVQTAAPALQKAAPATFLRVVQPAWYSGGTEEAAAEVFENEVSTGASAAGVFENEVSAGTAADESTGAAAINNTTVPVIDTVPATAAQTPAVQSSIVTTANPTVTTGPVTLPTVPDTTITPVTTTPIINPVPTAPSAIAPTENSVPAETLSAPVSPIAPAVQMPARSRVYIIEYSLQLTDLQKSVLESKTVLPLITDKNVAIFRVNAEGNGGALLEIYFDDGSKYSASYTWDEANKLWINDIPKVSVSPLNTASEINRAVLDVSAARGSLSFGRK
jgi:hypothetical protein